MRLRIIRRRIVCRWVGRVVGLGWIFEGCICKVVWVGSGLRLCYLCGWSDHVVLLCYALLVMTLRGFA